MKQQFSGIRQLGSTEQQFLREEKQSASSDSTSLDLEVSRLQHRENDHKQSLVVPPNWVDKINSSERPMWLESVEKW